MILTVTPHPALDLTWQATRIRVGETERVRPGATRAGGKGVNVARVAQAQGAEVKIVAPVGGETGSIFSRDLTVPAHLVPVAAATRRTVTVVDETVGDAAIFIENSEPLTPIEWDALVTAVAEELPNTQVLVISGSLPPGSPTSRMTELIALASAQRIPVVVDTSGDALVAAADAGATVLKPNREELITATGITTPLAAATSLWERGAALIVYSQGSDGLVAVGNLEATAGEKLPSPLQARLMTPLKGNPTGAGDAAVAALAFHIDRSEYNTEELLRAATAWSAAAVLMPLAGEISVRHLEFVEQVYVGPPEEYENYSTLHPL